MPTESRTTPLPVDPARVRRARRQLVALALIFLAPLLLAYYFVFFGGATGRRMNYGELVGPQPVPEAVAARLYGWTDPATHSPRRWLLVDIEAAPCAEACRARLEALRQIRLATARDEDRVARVVLLVDEAAPDGAPAVARDKDLKELSVPAKIAETFPGQGRIPDGHVYLLDPLGNVVLRFPPDLDRRRTLKDLTRLLQASQIG